jgi:type 1 glutamine amidotransferase
VRLPKALLITGLGTSDPEHPKHILAHEFYNDEIVRALEGTAQVTVTENLGSLNAQALSSYDLILNNSFLLEPAPEQLAALFEFIEGGGAYVALHAGLESFVNSPRYVRMMGGRLVGHSPPKSFTVDTFEDGFGTDRTTPWAHPIARGMAPFETHDELYVVQTNTDELEVIARAESHPIVWWRPWYNGAALAFTLGHARVSTKNAGYRQLLNNCVKWLLGYPMIAQPQLPVFTNDVGLAEDVLDLTKLTSMRGNTPVDFTLTNDRPDLVVATIDENRRVDLRFRAGRTGRAQILVTARSAHGLVTTAELAVEIGQRGIGNLARYHGVTAHSSSNEPRYLTASPSLVVDGDRVSRWSSNYVDEAWIYLDLGESYWLDRVRLLWDGAFAARYELQVSSDTRAWTTVASRDGQGGTEEIRFSPSQGRYVRMLANKRATRYGYSLHEFEVYAARR